MANWLAKKWHNFGLTDKYYIYKPREPLPEVIPKEDGNRYCSVCRKSFRSVKAYRDHHYMGMCGGY